MEEGVMYAGAELPSTTAVGQQVTAYTAARPLTDPNLYLAVAVDP